MKAQEYFDRYFADIENDRTMSDAAADFYVAMLGEVNDRCNQKHIKSTDAMIGVVREINDKWNSVAQKLEKKYGQKVLHRNVIWNRCLADGFPFDPRCARKPE